MVVLISSDGDYAYMLNRLRDNGVNVMVIHRALVHGPTPACLYDSADVTLPMTAALIGAEPLVEPASQDDAVMTEDADLCLSRASSYESVLSHASDEDGDFDTLLLIVHTATATEDWVNEAMVGSRYCLKAPNSLKGAFKKLRNEAVSRGLIQRETRQSTSTSGKVASQGFLQLTEQGRRLLNRFSPEPLIECGELAN